MDHRRRTVELQPGTPEAATGGRRRYNRRWVELHLTTPRRRASYNQLLPVLQPLVAELQSTIGQLHQAGRAATREGRRWWNQYGGKLEPVVAAAIAPLYFALGLGYGSVRWWKLFTADHCDAINRLFVYFAFPLLCFDFTARAGSFAAGYRVLAADAVAKLIVVLALVGCAAARGAKATTRRGGSAPSSYSWCITGFSLAALNNALLVGVPLLDAMYGKWAGDIIVQLSVLQVVVWFPLLLIVFEARQAWLEVTSEPADGDQSAREEGEQSALAEGAREDGSQSQAALGSDFEWPAQGENGRKTAATGCAFWAPLLRAVGVKLARNPNVYASLLGVAWSSMANRWHLKMPSIIDGSIAVMSKTGIGIGMFSMGCIATVYRIICLLARIRPAFWCT